MNLVISRHLGDDGKEMYQNAKRTCRAIVSVVVAVVFLNVVSSAVLNSQAGCRCTLVPGQTPVFGSPFPLLVTSYLTSKKSELST